MSLRRELTLVGLVALVVYFAWLAPSGGGFAFTEAMRAQPGWAMLEDSSSLLVPELFDQPYLRKPPGINWMIGASGWVFGSSEWSARAVSAACSVGMALVCCVFARRWFGRGLWAGLGCALTPLFWETGRAAEIEAANHFFALCAAVALIDAVVRPGLRLWRPVLLAVGIFGATLVKGPAWAALLVGVPAGLVLGFGRGVLRRMDLTGVAAGLILGASATALVYWRIVAATDGLDVVTQSPGEFLWSSPGKVFTAVFGGVAQAAPGALALFWVFGSGARRECGWDGDAMLRLRIARAVVFGLLLTVLVYGAAGLSNPRYFTPAAVLAPLLLGYLQRGFGGAFTRDRVLLGRAGAAGFVLLLAGWLAYVQTVEANRRGTTGRVFGAEAGRALEEAGAEVVRAHGVVEARAETLIEVERFGIDARWVPSRARLIEGAQAGDFFLVRCDGAESELGAFDAELELEVLVEGSVHEYRFAAVRVVRRR